MPLLTQSERLMDHLLRAPLMGHEPYERKGNASRPAHAGAGFPKVVIPEDGKPQSPTPASIEAHAPHGDKGDFIKVTATLLTRGLPSVGRRDRCAGSLPRNRTPQLSAILREAVVHYLGSRETDRQG